MPEIVLSASFPNLQTKVVWNVHSLNSMLTNTPFIVTANLSFPIWATANTFHPLAIDNPGPRPDLYSLNLSLYHANGSLCRQIQQQELSAINGLWNSSVEFILPSYIMDSSMNSSRYTFKIQLSNLDQLVSVVAHFKTVSSSPVFQIAKPISIDPSKENQVTDQMFIKHGDGVDGKTVSLYYGLWWSPNGPMRQLIKTIFTGSGQATSLEST